MNDNKQRIWARMRELAHAEKLTARQLDEYRQLERDLDRIVIEEKAGELAPLKSISGSELKSITGSDEPVRLDQVAVRSDQSLAPATDLSLNNYLRGIITGNWDGAEEERAQSEGTDTAGGFLVPTPLSLQMIDLTRAASRVVQAGAVTVPMDSETLKVATLDTDPSPAWRGENASIPESDAVFGAVTFTSKTLVVVTRISREVWEDASVSSGIGNVIADAYAKAFAQELDRVALLGDPSGGGDADEPEGVVYVTGVTNTALTAAPADYNFVIDAFGRLQDDNYTDDLTVIGSYRTERALAKLVTGTFLSTAMAGRFF